MNDSTTTGPDLFEVSDTFLDDVEVTKPSIPPASKPVKNQPKAQTSNDEELPYISNEIVLDKQTVVLKPIRRGNFRLGLEQQPEKFNSMPGVAYNWAPKRVGHNYRTGLSRRELGETPAERKAKIKFLEHEIGKALDNAFYAEMSVKLDPNKPLGEKFHLDRPFDLVIYLAMLESDQIANGMGEYKSGKKPISEWYIENKEAEAEEEASDRTQKMTMINEYGKLSSHKKYRLAIKAGLDVFGLKDIVIDNQLWKWLDKEGAEGTKNVGLFLKWVKLGDTYINVSAEVKEALRFNVIRADSTGDIRYGTTMLGVSEDEVISKLILPKYADIRKGITDRTEILKNGKI